MSGTELLVVIILVELVVIIGLVLATVLVLGGRRRRRERRAAENVASRIRSEENGRDRELRGILQERFGYTGDELDDKVRELVEAEKTFYTRFLDIYLNRDPAAAESVQEYLQDVVRPYAAIDTTPTAAGDRADEGAEPAPARAPDPDEPRDAADELHVYQQTLNLVFAEYTAMFGIAQDRNALLSAREIRERMESGQLAGSDDDAPR